MSFHTNPRLLALAPVTVFVVLSVGIAVLPAADLANTYRAPAAELPKEVRRGRDVYVREGCGYCHSQQVRVDSRLPRDEGGALPALAQDARYGPGSRPEDYAGDEPPLLGTQRNGPDLMNVADRLPSREWHLLHLYDPRLVSPGSIMPSYRWYFRGKDDHGDEDMRVPVPDTLRSRGIEVWATREAQDLAAYLLHLKPASRPR